MSTNGGTDPKVIEGIPLEILKTIPGGSPPPGVQPNFTDPPTLVPAILGVGIAFLVLAFICFAIRIYTKFAITKYWMWDDLTCFLGFVCSIVYFGVIVNGSVNGGNGRHLWDLHLDKVLNRSSVYQDYISTIMATPALGLIKCSLFIQFYMLFRPWRWARISLWIGASISAVFYIVVTVTAFILNSPWPGESLLEDVLSQHYIRFSKFSIPTGVISMLVDWYLLILPIRAVMLLQMSPAKKFGVIIVFMTGGLAAVASTVGLYYRVQLQNTLGDATWNVSYVLLWGQIEMFAGVAVSSMPSVSRFLIHHSSSINSWRTSLRSSLPHLLRRSVQERISDDNFSLSGLETNKKQASKDPKPFGIGDPESDDYQPIVAKILRMERSQIHPT